MTSDLLQSLIVLAIPVLGTGATVVAHIMASRGTREFGFYRAQFLGYGAGLALIAIMAIAVAAIYPGLVGRLVADVVIFVCFCYVYFHFNNMGETARRIRLLRDLMTAGRPLTFDELVTRYSAHEIIERRLTRLLAGGQIIHADGRYFVANRSVYAMSWVIGLSHWIVFGFFRRNPVAPQ